MRTKVMYCSRGGNTKKVADAIAQVLNQASEAVPPAYPPDNIKLMFLGTGVYGGKPDNKILEYIGTLRPEQVKNVALFGTAGSQDVGITTMRKHLKERGINVLDESFQCPGKYFVFFKRKHPTADDLKNAQDFARKMVEKMDK